MQENGAGRCSRRFWRGRWRGAEKQLPGSSLGNGTMVNDTTHVLLTLKCVLAYKLYLPTPSCFTLPQYSQGKESFSRQTCSLSPNKWQVTYKKEWHYSSVVTYISQRSGIRVSGSSWQRIVNYHHQNCILMIKETNIVSSYPWTIYSSKSSIWFSLMGNWLWDQRVTQLYCVLCLKIFFQTFSL